MLKNLDKAVNYLSQHKETYSLESLKVQLQNSGYPKELVDEAVAEVFLGKKREEGQARGFFDFKNTRTYKSFGSKLADFLFGFVGAIVLSWIIYGFLGNIFGHGYAFGYGIIGVIVSAVLGAGVFYFWKRRHYFARGILSIFIFDFIAFVLFWFLGRLF